ncbi:MAG: HAMP domain-containing sensor histidine kinase [Alistipes sp.]|jgi:signal transduction histidine kinase|nr:HAMP domain-containing histidine kinase [Alistipes sp.]MBQ1980843.1 HAMP domain-containing histidine kinase [Alistipes sp.]MBQ2415393.1 HAMP domain-containing histidine kinase [Alistipes sp.]MBQ5624019.1 HAMP domain-containing histidine kinase [Alistipes sp.]MBQ5786214.1 HAMP domain-containing histidine kinase [Alistipes sp.]
MKFKGFKISFRSRVSILTVGLILAVVSLFYTNKLADVLRQKEQHDVELWVAAMERVSREAFGNYLVDPLISHIVSTQNNIPFIITDENLNLVMSNRIDEEVLKDPERFRQKLDELTEENTPRTVRIRWTTGHSHIIFYGRSQLLTALYYFPYVQWLIIAIFLLFTYIALQSTKQDEQNRVWIGLAKETAHQLGTPISSLLGWVEYLRSMEVDPTAVDEMNKDLQHLMKIVDRFSKIGSETVLTANNVNEVVGETVLYFRKRVPRNVSLSYNGLAMAPVKANLNVALFEWVIENLMKNALDAMQGQGELDVRVWSEKDRVYIDVSDTGKGIAKGNWSRIFEPGFTTKTRGWGLGLSLSRRIVEDYHHGKIFVAKSEVGHGTTFRIMLKRAFE